uniref:Tropomodulin n=1 Tax=Halocynthia roretzi TaxID=7729 RepID=A7Y2Z2_HALRO|nr:tropomodulin [Halocynthia roretzi]
MSEVNDIRDKERQKYLELDEDDLLGGLNEEELEQLTLDLEELDPDNQLLPAGMRQKDQTKKKPTGNMDREKLMKYLEDEAKLIADIEDNMPYEAGMKRGKVFVPRDRDSSMLGPAKLDPELEEALDNASEAELTDIAAILGMHTLMNSDQFYSSLKSSTIANKSGYSSITKSELQVTTINEPPNPTDVGDTLRRIKENDPELTEVNLNNINNIPVQTLKEYCEALKTNDHVVSFSLANTRTGDSIAKSVGEMLKINRTLKILNVESNFLTSDGFKSILSSLLVNDCLEQLRMDNQRSQFGSKVETDIVECLTKNSTLLKFGYTFRLQGPRAVVGDHLTKNNDVMRKTRVDYNPSSVITKTEYKKK